MPRRCTTTGNARSLVHATFAVIDRPSYIVGRTVCDSIGVNELPADNTDPVTCTRCLAALVRLGDAIDACIDGRSG